MSSLFREYDIRGIAESELTPQIAWALGKALGEKIKAAGEQYVYVGQDVRLSSPRLAQNLSWGLENSGLKVIRIGEGPTPLLYFSAARPLPHHKTNSGIMVTGSHNPPEFNGFKMVVGGKTLYGDQIQELKKSVEKYLSEKPPTSSELISGTFESVSRFENYVSFLKNNISVKKKVRVVLDAGNGAAGPLAVKTFEALGCDVISIFCDPDGRFPNHHPDPTVPKNLVHLQKAVIEHKADLGIGFDGDGDRIGAVTSTGRILFGDHLILYLSRDIIAEVKNPTIISDVKSSQVLFDELKKLGANPILWKTGHSLIKAKLFETGAQLAGEMSGHIFFKHRYLGFDDAIYAGARLVESLSKRTETLDQFLDSLPPCFNTPEIRVDCPDDRKFEVVKEMVLEAKKQFKDQVFDLDGARIKFPFGWGLVRASNTQPILVFRFEASSKENLPKVRKVFVDLLGGIDKTITIPPIES